MSARSSERIRKKAAELPSKVEDSVKYFSGQGLAIRAGSSFSLVVCLDDVAHDDQSMQVARLRQSVTANKYEEGEETTVQDAEILTDIDIKKSGAFYKITRKQLQDLRKDLGMVEEKAPRSSSKGGPSKRAKASSMKKGKINHNIVVTRVSEVKDSQSSALLTFDSVYYNNRNLHRAARTSNIKLLRAIASKPEFISTFHPYWNPDNQTLPLEIAIQVGDMKFLKEFLVLSQKDHSFANVNSSCLFQVVNTGRVSQAAYGVHVRAVNMSRGGREGNNAFLADLHMGEGSLYMVNILNSMAKWITPKMFDFLLAHIKVYNDDRNAVGIAVQAGNLELARHIMEIKVKNGGFGFNQLHLEVLGNAPLSPFKKVSVTKKPIENFLVSPLHCAAINPDPKYLEALLSQCDDISYADSMARKAIHYAASCTSGSTVKLLLDSGANCNEPDRFKTTPLMIAAKLNRKEAAEALIAGGVVTSAKNRQGDNSICIAAKHDSLDVLRLLLDSGVDIESTGINKRTPLMVAAMMGNFECAEELLNRGAKVGKRDKHRKTALLYAVKNGEYAVATLLLHHGSDPNDPDSSKNYPLHYAASGCWPECIDLLLESGADINVQNDWKLSPLLVALLKGHAGVVTQLLKKPSIDVNCKDESGQTILSLAVGMLSEPTLEQMEYLLAVKQADPNIPDLGGNTPLHHLANLQKPVHSSQEELTKQQIEAWVDREWTLQVRACELLLRLGADVNAVNSEGMTPIFNAVLSKNTRLIPVLMQAGADLGLQDSVGRNIFHLTAQFDHEMWDFVLQILSDHGLVTSCLNSVDDEGYTPFLAAIKHFASTHSSVYNAIQAEVTEELEGKATNTGRKRKSAKVSREPRIVQTGMMTIKSAAPRKQLAFMAAKRATFGTKTARKSLPFRNAEDEEEDQQADDSLPTAITTITLQRFDALVDQFVFVLDKYLEAGADPNAKVEKLKKYRDDPEVLKAEYEESKLAPPEPVQPYWFGRQQTEKRTFFIKDIEGNTHWNEYNEHGMFTALHLISKLSNNTVTAFLTNKKIDLDARSFKGITALGLGAENSQFSTVLEIVIDAGANLNIVDYKGNSPLLKATHAGSLDNVKLMIAKGALPDLQNKKGDSALKSAVNQKNLKLVEALCEGGANTNLPDLKQRTPLHHAFNMAETSADASFDIEGALLEHGANINAKDRRSRTPLHYAFVKIGKPNDSKFIDPIETVSSACSIPGLDVNLQDLWGKTPLHYSAQHGSITSAMFLMSKGSNFEIQDNCGNTALTLSYIYSHPNYSFMMIQKGSSVTLPVIVPPEKKKVKAGLNSQDEEAMISLDMQDEAENQGEKDLNDNSSEDEGEKEEVGPYGADYDMWGNLKPKEESGVKMKAGTYSQFRAAVMHEWQGVAYLLLFNGFDYMLAMQDAMSEHKFQLVLTLLAKVQDNSIIQQVNSKGQNLYHTLAMHGANANYELTTAIGEKLLKRKVKHDVKDQDLRMPLHYAAESHYSFLVMFFIDHGCEVDSKDAYGITPLEMAIRGDKVTGSYTIVKTLKERGTNCNIQITEGDLKLTPLIHAVMHEAHIDLVKLLLEDHEVINLQDSNGRTALMHAIRTNNLDAIDALIATKRVDFDILDNEGKNAIHHIVKSCDFGSYENTDLLKLIHNATTESHSIKSASKTKAPASITPSLISQPDYQGRTPYWIAAHQGSGRMKKALEQLQVYEEVEVVSMDQPSNPLPTPNFREDSLEFINQQQQIRTETIEPRKPDPCGNFEKYYEVVDDYDLLMTKIDIKYGPFGGYVFYRMQLLRDVNRNVIVLFTRWGRIGEVGMNQRTAFSDLAAGEAEFCKIFKQKSGNEWGSPFNPVRGKYKLQQLNFKTVKYSDFLKPINYDLVPSRLPSAVAAALKAMTDIKMYHLQFTTFAVDINVLNFSNIPTASIDQAEGILKQISKNSKRLASGKITDTDEILNLKQEVMNLSSSYYELIPKTGYENTIIPPIQNDYDLKANFELISTLRNVEAASKMLLAAKLRERTVSPLRYIIDCMEVGLDLVDPATSEHQLLARYIEHGGYKMDKVGSILRVNRYSEAERIKQWADVKNRKLLWHGSTNANFVGILSQGLKIAPAEAPSIGWMFGKGLYFADNMMKSIGYTEQGQKDSFILLCEVVLGKLHRPEVSFTSSKLPKNCLSTYAQGYTGPDYTQSVFLDDGVEVPCGPICDYEAPPKKQWLVQNSEFIVYDASQVRIRYLLHLKSKAK